MRALVAVLPGDGIGPEVCEQATRVLDKIAALGGHEFELHHALIGGQAINMAGSPLPPETVELCRTVDAVLLGAVGDPRFDGGTVRPEQGLLELRTELELHVNVRPVKPHPQLIDSSPLKARVMSGVDMVIVRELTGGLYYGDRGRDGDRAFDTCVYTREEIERVTRVAAEMARARSGLLTSVDKANVLATSRLWRETVTVLVAAEYPDITLEHRLVDSAAMHLITHPSDLDVVVTENMFGDILSDEASVLAGSLGMLPSASLGPRGMGLYEPVHGSAPDIAGKGVANPYGAILSVAMLLRHSLGLPDEAEAVEAAVAGAIEGGVMTADLGGSSAADTWQAGSAVVERLSHASSDSLRRDGARQT